MKTKLLLLSTSLCAISSVAVAPAAIAQFLCQAQKNAYILAVDAFNASPTYANAQAVAQTQAEYESCMAIVSQPAFETSISGK